MSATSQPTTHRISLLSSIALTALLSLTLVLGLLSDSLAEQPLCKERRVDVTGSFDSNWGAVHLEQDGARIVGTYECCGGGRIVGTLSGSVIDYAWEQPGTSGHGRWEVVDDGDKLLGTWGTGESRTSGGAWDLKRRGSTSEPPAIAR